MKAYYITPCCWQGAWEPGYVQQVLQFGSFQNPCHLSELHNLAGWLKRFKSDEENRKVFFDSDAVLKKKKKQAGKKGIQSANVQELPISAFMWFKAIY